MSNSSDRSRSNRDLSLIVRSDWSIGPRTAAWDRLWRAILGDIGAIPTTDAREPLESEMVDA